MYFFLGLILIAAIIGIPAAIILLIIRSIKRNSKRRQENLSAPLLTVNAQVIKKWRMAGDEYSPTDYYARFQLQNSGIMTFEMKSASEYKKLTVGDVGLLTYQGEWYRGFVRS